MSGLRNVKMAPKLMASLILIGVLPLAAVGWLAMENASQALLEKSYSQLESVRESKKNAVERYFQGIGDQIVTFSENRMVVRAMGEFSRLFTELKETNGYGHEDIARMRTALKTYYTQDFATEYAAQNDGAAPDVETYFSKLDKDSIVLQYLYIKNNPKPLGSKHELDLADDGSPYSALHGDIHPIVRNYLDKFGYYDIFLANAETGDIVYSVFKELDYSTSLKDGPYADTNFGEAFRRANQAAEGEFVVLTDYRQYPPSYEAPASFIASPVFENGKRLGVALFQMPIDSLTSIMSERAGLGKTGEAYLVGPDHKMRSDSYLDPENHSVIASFRHPETGSVETRAVAEALKGRTDEEVIIDYNGNPVLSAYTPVQVGEATWALMAEIDEAEVTQPIRELLNTVILMGGIIIVIVAVVALGIAISITRPLKRAMRFAETIAEGDFSTTLDLDQKDEIGLLADAMRKIPETLTDLQEEVRTVSMRIDYGHLRARCEIERFQGEYRQLLLNVNTMADVLVDFIDTVPMPLLSMDMEHAVLFMNKAGAELNNATPEETAGSKCYDLFQTPNCNTPHCACHMAMEDSKAHMGETDAHPQAGDMEIKYIGSPNHNQAGEVVGAFEIVIDQTAIVTSQRTIRKVADQTLAIVERLTSASEELSAQISEASQGAGVQHDRSAEAATAMEQMNATVIEVAQNASSASESAESASGMAGEGATVVDDLVAAINEVQGQAENLKNNMASLGTKAEDIGEIMNVINDIADQTNLLALNAAIEAARAGDVGRGFAVVADEVRKLAEKTMAATKEVGDAITAIQSGARQNVAETEKAVEAVGKSTGLASKAGAALGEILDTSQGTARQVRAIATATEQQAAATEEIAHSTGEINRIAQETSSAMEQSALAVNELAELASDLQTMITELRGS